MIYVNCPKGKTAQSQEGLPDQVHSDQMVLGTVRWEAVPCEKWPKALKIKVAQGGPSGSSPLRSDGSHDGQAGGWTTLTVAIGAQRESRKAILGS